MSDQDLFELLKSSRDTCMKIRKELGKRNIDWQIYATGGLKHEAMAAFCEKHNCGMKEAYDAVNHFLSELNQPLQETDMRAFA